MEQWESMITLYTNRRAIPKDKKFIEYVDLYFDAWIYDITITDADKVYMREIDHAEYEGNGYIVTCFGRTEIQNLSTGCKTLILINHYMDNKNVIINIGECGKNVLDKIYAMKTANIYIDFYYVPNVFEGNKEINVVTSSKERNMQLIDVFCKLWRR